MFPKVLKLLKMAVGMRALLNTVIQALPQVGNLGLLFMLLFFIFAALGVELFGDLECDDYHPCEGLGRHATFRNFGMAFLTLFRVSTGDNWNGIMKDTLRDCNQEGTCYNTVVSPIYFVSFVLTAQFVLVNVVIAVLMKHLEESNKEAKEEAELEAELELELKMLNINQGNVDGVTWGGSEGGDAGDSPGSPSESLQIKVDSPFSLEPPLDKQFFDDVSLLIQGSLEGELTLMDNLSGSVCHNYAISQQNKCCAEKQGEDNQEQEAKEEIPEKNLLTVRKPFVGRTHSLPNDSYMFQPVDPAPLEGLQRSENNYKLQSGSTTSVQSQPTGTSGHLQVPIELFLPVSRQNSFDSENIPKIPPPRRSVSAHRMLRRQVAVTNDSLDPLYMESKENLQIQPNEPTPLNVSVPHVSVVQPSVVLLPASPSAPTKHSVHIQQHSSNQCNITNYVTISPRHARNPFRELPDSADQEVSQINCGSKRASKPPMCPTLPTKMCSSTGNLTMKDVKKFYSVDTQGFLAKPTSWLDDPRRHSIEICSSVATVPQHHFASSSCWAIGQTATELDSQQAARQKQKMSPPCISIDPPEDQHTTMQGTHGQTSSSDMCLRRRAPSCDSAPHKESVDLVDPLLPESTATSPSPAKDLLTLSSFSLDQPEEDH
ncbi:hypothetical protein scyTo_0015673 [Scyliorhinus torazame]|uniref:Ion transport domain-containing protein n=1 Tax=Scyliorhinus torazame TaxID=75743 RepID=A0A401PWJ0_SCYTO|nr:hypothetical protein [Scyliorhinus torazame]